MDPSRTPRVRSAGMTITVPVTTGLGRLASPAQAHVSPGRMGEPQDPRLRGPAGGGTVETYLSPGGFGTPFQGWVGSSDVITPEHVEVVFPGTTEPVTTLDVPGFSRNAPAAVQCTYTDPAGLIVTFLGHRV